MLKKEDEGLTDSSINKSIKPSTAHNLSDQSGLDVQVFQSFEELGEMQLEWDEFMESVHAEIFLTFDWCKIWWRYYGKNRRLLIFIFRSQGDIVGILPIFIEKIWLALTFAWLVKLVVTDFMPITVIVPVKEDFLDAVISRFLQELNLRCYWEILHIGAISGKYRLINELSGAFRKVIDNSHIVNLKSNDVQTYYEVADTWEKQLSGMNKKNRKNMNRAYRQLSREGRSYLSTFASNSNSFEYFTEFVKLHQEHWQRLGKTGHFVDWPDSYEFHRDAVEAQMAHDRLRLLRIKVGEECLGYKYGYRFGELYYSYLTGRGYVESDLRLDFNRIAFGELIQKAIKEKIRWIDSMRGRYDHKTELGGFLRPIQNIYIYSKKIDPRFRVILFRRIAWLLDICYAKIWRRRLAPILKIKLTSFLDIWIRTHSLSY